MASKSSVSATVFLWLNLLMSFAFVNNAQKDGFPAPVTCPIDALCLRTCVGLLGVRVVVGNTPAHPCCSLVTGLGDLQGAVCVCTAIRANVLGLNLNVPIAIRAVLNNYRRQYPNGFQCADPYPSLD